MVDRKLRAEFRDTQKLVKDAAVSLQKAADKAAKIARSTKEEIRRSKEVHEARTQAGEALRAIGAAAKAASSTIAAGATGLTQARGFLPGSRSGHWYLRAVSLGACFLLELARGVRRSLVRPGPGHAELVDELVLGERRGLEAHQQIQHLVPQEGGSGPALEELEGNESRDALGPCRPDDLHAFGGRPRVDHPVARGTVDLTEGFVGPRVGFAPDLLRPQRDGPAPRTFGLHFHRNPLPPSSGGLLSSVSSTLQTGYFLWSHRTPAELRRPA